jgi:hypothetical protein
VLLWNYVKVNEVTIGAFLSIYSSYDRLAYLPMPKKIWPSLPKTIPFTAVNCVENVENVRMIMWEKASKRRKRHYSSP